MSAPLLQVYISCYNTAQEVLNGKKKIGQREQAPPGTYDYLFAFRRRIYNHPTKLIGCSIQEERFYEKTGGSCMDLLIKHGSQGIHTTWHAHITDKNEIVDLECETYNFYKSERAYSTPDIADMIKTVKDIRAQFDIDPYERPIV